MGSAQATDMAECVSRGMIGLRPALHWHLTANHYPPIPECMIDVAEAALKAYAEGADMETATITLPEGIEHRQYGREVPVRDIIKSLHLEPFLYCEPVCVCGHTDSEHKDLDLRAGEGAWACLKCDCDGFEEAQQLGENEEV